MNAKLCKKLRRAAAAQGSGLPARAIKRHATKRLNSPESVRGIYRKMKKEAQWPQ